MVSEDERNSQDQEIWQVQVSVNIPNRHRLDNDSVHSIEEIIPQTSRNVSLASTSDTITSQKNPSRTKALQDCSSSLRNL
jgi:S-ribosylhomocysteine lyase LuxS involved in autoinducer biosynthesis